MEKNKELIISKQAKDLAELKEGRNLTGKDLLTNKPIAEMTASFKFLKDYAALVKSNLVKDVDYGKAYSKSKKVVLLKSGMEKVLLSYGLYAELTELKEIIDFKLTFVFYKFKATLKTKTGSIISIGYGSCNSKETSKVNKNFFDNINTVMKIAIKRAKMDAALGLGALSGQFTQDYGDDNSDIDKPEYKKTHQEAAQEVKSQELTETPNDGARVFINCLRYYFARERGLFSEPEKAVVRAVIKESIAIFNRSFAKNVVGLEQATNTSAELEAIFNIFKKITDINLTKPTTKPDAIKPEVIEPTPKGDTNENNQ